MGLGSAQALSVAQMLASAAATYGIAPELALAVAQRESGLNPNLINPVSGAAGVMQLMPATAAALGVTNIMDPLQNVNAGVKYLAQLVNKYGGDVGMAVAAYDWGPGNLDKAIAQYGDNWLANAPMETQNYVLAITGESPASVVAAAAPAQPPLTIDATTGQPVTSTVDVSTLPTIDASGNVTASAPASGIDAGTAMSLALVGLGVWLAYDLLAG
jgi:hypothetical protein